MLQREYISSTISVSNFNSWNSGRYFTFNKSENGLGEEVTEREWYIVINCSLQNEKPGGDAVYIDLSANQTICCMFLNKQ